MQAIERPGFTRQQIIDALHASKSSRIIKFRYDLLNRNENKIGEITTMESAEVRMSALSTIKRSGRFVMKDDSGIDWLNDRIQPFMSVKVGSGWAEWPLGIFLLSTPERKERNQTAYKNIEAYDGLQVLSDDKADSRLAIDSGTEYGVAIKSIIESAGITKINIPESSSVLAITKEWPPGTSKLSIVNELLGETNYTQLWVDENGYYTSSLYVSPADRASEYEYKSDALSVIRNGATEEIDLFSVPNKWVVTASNPERDPLVSTYTNSNPLSITSTVRRGRTIVDARQINDIADQDALDDYVRRIAFEASQVMSYVTFETALMPFHSFFDVVWLNYSSLNIDGKYSETNWTMPLYSGAKMTHKARKVVKV
jgi:hypothetical protein